MGIFRTLVRLLVRLWSRQRLAAEPGADAVPQLNYALGNPGAPGTIYVSTNTADNQLTLVMSSTVTASFTVGTLVPPAEASAGTGSLLYLNLTPLGLTDAEFNALQLVSTGWTYALYSGPSGQYIGFAPTAPASLPSSTATIAFALEDFALAQQPGASASLELLAYRVAGVSGNFPVAGSMTVLFALPDDDQRDLTAAMEAQITPAQVVASLPQYPQIANQLQLVLTQDPNVPTINAGPDTLFTLTFAYASDANGFGALLTTEEAKGVRVTAAEGTADWTITPLPDADPPFWTLAPPPNAPIFPAGQAGGTLALDIGKLVTTFQPGPTVVLLGYSNVPGFKNGSYAITLIKQAHVAIDRFLTTGAQVPAEVTLSWVTSNAAELTLQIGDVPNDVTGENSFSFFLDELTPATLTAVGYGPSGVDNRAIATLQAPGTLQTVYFNQGFPTGCPSEPTVYAEAGLSFSNSIDNRWCPFVSSNPNEIFVRTAQSPSSITITPVNGGPITIMSLLACGPGGTTKQQSITIKGTDFQGRTYSDTWFLDGWDTEPGELEPSGINMQSVTIELEEVAIGELNFLPYALGETELALVREASRRAPRSRKRKAPSLSRSQG